MVHWLMYTYLYLFLLLFFTSWMIYKAILNDITLKFDMQTKTQCQVWQQTKLFVKTI